jgi:hypothetical protein
MANARDTHAMSSDIAGLRHTVTALGSQFGYNVTSPRHYATRLAAMHASPLQAK